MEQDERWCNRCQDKRPISEFYRDAARPSGFQPYCSLHMQEANAQSRRRRMFRKLKLVA